MNTLSAPRTPAPGNRPRSLAAAVGTRPATLFFALLLGAGMTSCSFLKPAPSTTRHFVLSPVTAQGPTRTTSNSLAVGVGQVKIPAYLFDTSLAVRRGSNEIEYLPSLLWAERLDKGFQRVLAANLAVLLPTDQVRLSAWRSEDVATEIQVTLEQFDVGEDGRAVLIAQWRVRSPGGEQTLKAGESRLSQAGPAPESDPAGAVATLSQLLAELSRQVAQAVSDTTPLAR